MPTPSRRAVCEALEARDGLQPLAVPGSTNPVRPVFQGVLSLMLLFTVVEFCVAVPTSILAWRQAHVGVPGVSLGGPVAWRSGGSTGGGHGTVTGGAG